MNETITLPPIPTNMSWDRLADLTNAQADLWAERVRLEVGVKTVDERRVPEMLRYLAAKGRLLTLFDPATTEVDVGSTLLGLDDARERIRVKVTEHSRQEALHRLGGEPLILALASLADTDVENVLSLVEVCPDSARASGEANTRVPPPVGTILRDTALRMLGGARDASEARIAREVFARVKDSIEQASATDAIRTLEAAGCPRASAEAVVDHVRRAIHSNAEIGWVLGLLQAIAAAAALVFAFRTGTDNLQRVGLLVAVAAWLGVRGALKLRRSSWIVR